MWEFLVEQRRISSNMLIHRRPGGECFAPLPSSKEGCPKFSVFFSIEFIPVLGDAGNIGPTGVPCWKHRVKTMIFMRKMKVPRINLGSSRYHLWVIRDTLERFEAYLDGLWSISWIVKKSTFQHRNYMKAMRIFVWLSRWTTKNLHGWSQNRSRSIQGTSRNHHRCSGLFLHASGWWCEALSSVLRSYALKHS